MGRVEGYGLLHGWSGRAAPVRAHCKVMLDAQKVGHYSRVMSTRRPRRAIESCPVGAAEVADRLGVKPQTVHTWRHRGVMPGPRWTVSGQPAWEWREIEEWARRTGRLRSSGVHARGLALEGTGWDGDLVAMRTDRVRRA